MKRHIIVFAAMLVLAACDDIELRYFTRINADGSVFKRITAVGDSSKVYDHPFSFNVEDGWQLKYDKKIENGGKDTVFYAIASQTFLSVNAASKAMFTKIDTAQDENIDIRYNHKFRWFYSFHEYEEVFLQRFPYHHLKIEDYLSAEERGYFFNEDTSFVQHLSKVDRKKFEDEAELKWFDFIISSIHIEYMRLLNAYAKENNKTATSASVEQEILEVFKSSIDDGPELKGICQITDSLHGSNWVSLAYSKGYFAEFEFEIDEQMILLSSKDYNVEIEVPGLIYDSNAQEINGQTVKWQFEGDVFQYSDYPLTVYYRTTNLWAFIITIFVIILIVWLGFVRTRR